mmetsp:Transcript_5400/g.9730  ORF Transcript_5400/g.9730 Transcript_5400/m.9730 type:complete len:86 (+) Transcript_5400:458-715(+)
MEAGATRLLFNQEMKAPFTRVEMLSFIMLRGIGKMPSAMTVSIWRDTVGTSGKDIVTELKSFAQLKRQSPSTLSLWMRMFRVNDR